MIRAARLLTLAGTLFLADLAQAGAAAASPEAGAPAPAFTHTTSTDWLNSRPLTWTDLRGSVVLVDFWAFECWNCYRSIPWLHDIESRFASRGLRIISVHTPELPSERVRDNVVQKIAEYHLTNPVMLDNDYSYWKALGNQYWPAFYLVDRQGRLRAVFYGETHSGDGNARQMEAALDDLLGETGQP